MRFLKRWKWTITVAVSLLFLVGFAVTFYWLVASYLDRGAATMFFAGYFTCLAITGLSRAAVMRQ